MGLYVFLICFTLFQFQDFTELIIAQNLYYSLHNAILYIVLVFQLEAEGLKEQEILRYGRRSNWRLKWTELLMKELWGGNAWCSDLELCDQCKESSVI